jgi:arylsulfatase A-like enzyme
MGNSQAKTPNLDRLAKRGVTFTNAHCPGVYCTPSRTAIMTGTSPMASSAASCLCSRRLRAWRTTRSTRARWK